MLTKFLFVTQPFSEVVSLTQTELADKETAHSELQQRNEQMQSDFEYELKKRERDFEARMQQHSAELEKDLKALELKCAIDFISCCSCLVYVCLVDVVCMFV